MRIADFFLVLPTFVLAIILTSIIRDVVGVGLERDLRDPARACSSIVVVIGITSWSSTARIIRSQTLSLKERAFVDRARVIGGGGAPHHAPPHPAERRQPHRRQRRPRRSPARSSPRRRCRSSASAIRSSRRGARSSTRRGRSARRASARGGTSCRPARASSSWCSPSRWSAARSTTCSTRSRRPPVSRSRRPAAEIAAGRRARSVTRRSRPPRRPTTAATPLAAADRACRSAAASGPCPSRRTRRRRCWRSSDLRTHFRCEPATVQAVDGVSFRLDDGEALGIAGESGCGKTTTALSLVRLLPATPRSVDGQRQADGHRPGAEVRERAARATAGARSASCSRAR